jgi:branched-chain amino acid transport system substrate-binding protein
LARLGVRVILGGNFRDVETHTMFKRSVLAIVVGLALAGCGQGASPSPSGSSGTAATEVKIGLEAPMTDFAAADGESARTGAQLAIDYVNTEAPLPGINLALVVEDDQAKADQGPTVAQRLMSQGVAGVVGGSYSGPLRAAAPVYQQGGTPMVVAYAVHPDITKAGDLIYRIWPVADVEGAAVAKYAAEELGLKSVAVLNLDNDFGTSLAAGFTTAFKATGGTVPVAKTGAVGDKDYRAALTEIRAANPDGLFVAAYYTEGAQIAQQAADLGLDVKIIGAGMDSPQFLKLAGAAANGMVYLSTFNPVGEGGLVKWFVERYRAARDLEPDSNSAASFDSVLVLADAIRRAGTSDPAALSKAIKETDLEGVTGHLTFDGNREVQTTVYFHEVNDGAIKTVGEVEIGG